MANYKGARVLIMYSNPSDSSRLRLDKEHREVDQVLEQLNLNDRVVRRLHATTLKDFISVINESDYEILQFSGHGSGNGIYLEDSKLNKGRTLSAKKVTAILKASSAKPKAAIFISCFSASSIPDLIDIAPYLITVSGSTTDEAAIKFVREFYTDYFRSGSIEHAFLWANIYLDDENFMFDAVLSRRAEEKLVDRVLYQVFPSRGQDSIFVDLTEAEADIQGLGISRDNFLSLLCRKIRIHQWIFNSPREQALISIGPFFGVFSWNDPNDVVRCKSVLKVKKDVDEKTCGVWAGLLVSYNDRYIDKYRSKHSPSDPVLKNCLEHAIERHNGFFQFYFEDENQACLLRNAVPEQFKVAKALIHANLRMCDSGFHQEDYKSTVAYLESTLSTVHDFIDGLTMELTE